MATADRNLLTQAQYARSRSQRGLPGGSRESVRKAVEAGRITAFGPDKMVDRDLADTQWERNTRTRFSPEAAAVQMALATARGPDVQTSAQVKRTAGSEPPTARPMLEADYSEARARRERAEAEEAEMRTAKIRGTMVLRDDVDRGTYEVLREARDRLTAAGRRLASELANISSAEACESVIDREHRIVLELMVSAFREKLGTSPKAGV